MKTQSWAILREFVQPNAAHVTTMMTLWKITTVLRSSSWNFLSLHYVIFYSPNSSNTTENVTFQVPFQGISWENIHFCGFLKKTYIANGRKIKVNSTKKYVQFLSSGYFFLSYISPLIDGLWKYCNLKEFTNKQNKKSDLILENNIFNLLKLVRNPHLLDAREALLWKFQLIFLALHAIICAIIHAKGSIINTGTIT